MIVKIIVIALYAIMVIAVGIAGMKKTRSFNDFLLGGGKVGPWMTAFSYGTAYFSAVLFIGFAGKIGWAFGLSGLWIGLINAIVGVFLVWALLGWRIKQFSVKYNIATVNEFLETRYDSPFLKLLSSIVIFIFLIPYSAAVFMGLSYLFTATFGFDYSYVLLFMGIFTAVYVVLGGYNSMAIIDMIFGIIMTIGVVILFFFTVDHGGGMGNIVNSLSEIDSGLTQAVGPPGFWQLFCLIFLTSIAPFAMPQLVQKFYAVKDRATIKRGMIASAIFALLIGGVAYYVGSTTRIFLSPENAPNAFADGKPVFDQLMPELLTKVIPDSLSVIILLLILAASMSTLASLVLISGSAFSKDFWAGFINKKMSDKGLTRMVRWMSAFFIALSVLLAFMNLKSIVFILSISWGAIGSFFLGPFVWGLLLKRTNKLGAITSAVSGLSVCIVLYICSFSPPEAGTIGMMVSLVTAPVISLLSKQKHCEN